MESERIGILVSVPHGTRDVKGLLQGMGNLSGTRDLRGAAAGDGDVGWHRLPTLRFLLSPFAQNTKALTGIWQLSRQGLIYLSSILEGRHYNPFSIT